MVLNTKRRGFTLVELMVVIGILGLLVGILAVAVLPKLMGAKADLEKKQMGEVVQALQQATIDSKNKTKFRDMKEKAGRAFWSDCFKYKVLDVEIMRKIVCLGSEAGDSKAESDWLEDPNGSLKQENCSYTSPKGGELVATMNLRGKNKAVVICFDSRNWNSYKDKGVLCAWSEGDAPEYLDAGGAEQQYRLTKNDWENPRTVIGQKPPFNKTYEEKK